MTRKFIEDVFSKIPEGVETCVFGDLDPSRGDAEICVLCEGDWYAVAFTSGNGGEKLAGNFDAVVAKAAADARKDVKTEGGQAMADRESELAKACDGLAKAVRERDQFKSRVKSNDWSGVYLNGKTGVSLWLSDKKLMDGVLELCAKSFDRRVDEAKDALEIVGAEAFKKPRQP